MYHVQFLIKVKFRFVLSYRFRLRIICRTGPKTCIHNLGKNEVVDYTDLRSYILLISENKMSYIHHYIFIWPRI